MKADHSSEQVLDDAAIEEFLRKNWEGITRRAAHKVARRVVWDRRFAHANRFLAAAAVLMSVQFAWGTLTLYRLVH